MNVRDLLLAALNPKPVAVEVKGNEDVPGWGVVYVRVMTAGDIAEAQEDAKKYKDDPKMNVARFVCRSMATGEGDGTNAFNINSPEDVKTVRGQPWVLLMEFVHHANRINGVEAAEKD